MTLKVVSLGGAGIAMVPSQWRLKGWFLLLMVQAHLCFSHTPHEASLTHFVICFTPELHARQAFELSGWQYLSSEWCLLQVPLSSL